MKSKLTPGKSLLVICGLWFAASGCGGGGGQPAPPEQVTISVSASSATVLLGNTAQFNVTVSGTSNTAVAWSVDGIPGGNAKVGTISNTGLYTAPGDLPSPAATMITATSQADSTKSASASISVTSDIMLNAGLNPPNTFSVTTGGTVQLSVTISSAGHPDPSINWSVNGVTNGNSVVGQISVTGTGTATYTAPAAAPNINPVTIAATSAADPSSSQSVSLKIASILASQSQLIKAAQGGTITLPDGSNVVIPPGVLASDQTVTLQSVTDLPLQPPSGFLVNVGPGLVLKLSSPNTAVAGLSDQPIPSAGQLQTSSSSNDIQFTVNVSQGTVSGSQGAGGLAYLTDTGGNTSAIGSQTTFDSALNTVTMMQDGALLGKVVTIGMSMVNLAKSGTLSPPAGPRHFDGSSWSIPPNGTTCPSGKVLVLVHGMGSTVEKAFDCASDIAIAGNYSDVEGFDYNWTQGINQSGQQLAAFLNSLAACPSVSEIDVEGHSEGVAVAGSAITQATQAQGKIKNFVGLGGPIAGTPVADLIEAAIQSGLPLPASLTTLLGNFPFPAITAAGFPSLQAVANAQFIKDLQTSSNVLPMIWQQFNKLPNIKMIVACGNQPTFTDKVSTALNLLIPNDDIVPVSSCLGQNSGLTTLPLAVGPPFPVSHTDLECKSPEVIKAVGTIVKKSGTSLISTPSAVSSTAAQGSDPLTQTLITSTTSGSTVSWQAATDASWLSVLPTTGSTGNNFSNFTTLTVTVGTLQPGTYHGNVIFSSDEADNTPLNVPVTLTVQAVFKLLTSTTGTGSGTVSPNPAGTSCGAGCFAYLPTPVTTVQLTATANPGSTFVQWSGDCSSAGACSVTMNQNHSVTADFELVGPPPPTTGTWKGSWTRPISGLCNFETSALTWNLSQSGSNVSGTFSEVVTAIDPEGICPDSVGDTKSGNLVDGMMNGNSLTIFTDGGTQFVGTVTATTISGTGGTSLGTGPFNLTRQ